MKTYKILFTAALMFFGSFSLAAKPRSVSVRGNCLRSIKPNQGSLSFIAETRNKDSEQAMKEATVLFQNARAEIQKLNLKGLELQTTENSVSEDHTWENNSNVFKGYRARVGLKVITTDLDRLGEISKVLAKAGIKNIGELMTEVSPEKFKEEQEACLEQAITNSKSKASKLAKAAGAKVGKVLFIEESADGSHGQPHPMVFASARMKGAESMSADSGFAPTDVRDQDISVNIHVIYLLE